MNPHLEQVAVRLDVPGTNNVRDIGGYPAADGLRVARGRAVPIRGARAAGIRAESLWDPSRAEDYKALGVRTVVDLRSESEAELVPTAWGQATGACLPIPEGVEGTNTHFMKLLLDGKIKALGRGGARTLVSVRLPSARRCAR